MTNARLLLVVSTIILIASVFLFTQSFSETPETIQIGEANLKVETALTEAERARGLSGRESLREDQGLLFVYDEPGIYSFWMKDMNFAIDIIWIDENKKIIDITHDARPESYPSTFIPQSPAQYVLEVNSGWAERHGVEVGDTMNLLTNL